MAKTMRALKVDSPGKASVHSDISIPSLRSDYILVKTVAVALNPTDWKHINFVNASTTIGCDYASIVEEVGSAVTVPFKKGDRIVGFVHGGNPVQPEDGAFGEYLVAKWDLQIKIPDGMSWEDAATLGVGITTVAMGQGLYPDQPAKEKFPILIYGASTATSVLGVQFAKLSGLEVIATCSPHNFEMLKSLGADAVFDRNDPECGAKIRKYTNSKLFYAWDCYLEGPSLKICCDALSDGPAPDGKKPYWGILLPAQPTRDVNVGRTLGYTMIGDGFYLGGNKFPAKPQDFEFGKKWWSIAWKLLSEGKIKLHKVEVRPGGLDGILDGLDDLKNGKVSGKKLVCRISDVE